MRGHVAPHADDEDLVARIGQGLGGQHRSAPALVLVSLGVGARAPAAHRVGPVGDENDELLAAAAVGVDRLVRVEVALYARKSRDQGGGPGDVRGAQRGTDVLRAAGRLVDGAGGTPAVDLGVPGADVAQLRVGAVLEFAQPEANVHARLVGSVDRAVAVVVEDGEKGLAGDLVARAQRRVARTRRIVVEGARTGGVAVEIQCAVPRVVISGGVPLHTAGEIEDDHGIGGDGREEPLLGVVVVRPGRTCCKEHRRERDRAEPGCRHPFPFFVRRPVHDEPPWG